MRYPACMRHIPLSRGVAIGYSLPWRPPIDDATSSLGDRLPLDEPASANQAVGTPEGARQWTERGRPTLYLHM